MKQERFTEEQVIGVLKEHELDAKTADLCRKHGNNEATFYDWRRKFGRLEVSEAKRLMALETENVKLKRLLADAMLGNTASNDRLSKMVTPAVKREAVTHLRRAHEMSERLADAGRSCRPVLAATEPRRCARRWLCPLARCRPRV